MHVSPIKRRDFLRAIKKANFVYDRTSGDHEIYVNAEGKHISIPYGKEINAVMGRRLLKENGIKL